MKLILHPGIHKTGTTSIQSVLFKNREWLSQRGLFYPVITPFTGSRAHHKFAHVLALERANGRKLARKFLQTAARVASPYDTIILSSEPIYRHYSGGGWAGLVAVDYLEKRRAYLAVLAEVLAGFEVEVIFYLRDYGYWLAWLHRVLTREGIWSGSANKFKEEFGERFSYNQQISMFAAHFTRIRILSYEEAKGVGLIQHFFDSIGYPIPPGSVDIWERPTKSPIVPI
jgi:hypothetical protein